MSYVLHILDSDNTVPSVVACFNMAPAFIHRACWTVQHQFTLIVCPCPLWFPVVDINNSLVIEDMATRNKQQSQPQSPNAATREEFVGCVHSRVQSMAAQTCSFSSLFLKLNEIGNSKTMFLPSSTIAVPQY